VCQIDMKFDRQQQRLRGWSRMMV